MCDLCFFEIWLWLGVSIEFLEKKKRNSIESNSISRPCTTAKTTFDTSNKINKLFLLILITSKSFLEMSVLTSKVLVINQDIFSMKSYKV